VSYMVFAVVEMRSTLIGSKVKSFGVAVFVAFGFLSILKKRSYSCFSSSVVLAIELFEGYLSLFLRV